MGDRVAVMRDRRPARPVRDAGRAADGAGRRVRRGLRRRRPGAEAACAAARRRHRPLAGAARLRRPGHVARCARSSPGAEVPYALLVDSAPAPARLALGVGSRRAPTVPERPASAPDPILDEADVMRDALSDLLRAETHYAPVVDGSGALKGVLSVEIIHEFLNSDGGAAPTSTRRTSARWADRARRRDSPRSHRCSRAGDGFVRDANSGTTPMRAGQRHGLLRLGVRQLRPLRDADCCSTSSSSLISVAIGFLIAFTMAVVSHGRRWIIPVFTGLTRRHLHDPEHRPVSDPAADHRPRHGDGDHRAQPLHAADHLPQHRHRARQRARPRAQTPAAAWG